MILSLASKAVPPHPDAGLIQGKKEGKKEMFAMFANIDLILIS